MKKYLLFLYIPFMLLNQTSLAAGLSFESLAFKQNTMIPDQYTCNGADSSPPFIWDNVPEKTQSLALVVVDPDAEKGPWTHWLLFNIPPTVKHLDIGSPVPEGALSGKNSWGDTNYRGPCPPLGAHRYVFTLYALDTTLSMANGASSDEILHAMTGHVLDSVALTGLYQK